MTAITAIITDKCCAHATDSLITLPNIAGGTVKLEYTRPKLIKKERFKAIISYWGLAKVTINDGKTTVFDAYEWLDAYNIDSIKSPSECAASIAADLNAKINGMIKDYTNIKNNVGIGVHFTAYEIWNEKPVPELFLISNFDNVEYNVLRSTGIGASRETYKTITNGGGQLIEELSGNSGCRKIVYEYLQAGGMIIFNNGDPKLFNPCASAIINGIRTLRNRGAEKPFTEAEYSKIARRSIEITSKLVSDFGNSNKKVIGGKIHDLCVNHHGSYYDASTTIDRKFKINAKKKRKKK